MIPCPMYSHPTDAFPGACSSLLSCYRGFYGVKGQNPPTGGARRAGSRGTLFPRRTKSTPVVFFVFFFTNPRV